jgi:vacuolar-type H+-ATPase subunit I/STV1
VSKDTPRPGKSTRERGTYARHGGDPTLASYLSSLLFLLSVPGCLALAYGGHWAGLYSYAGVVPVFGLALAGVVVVAFAVMSVRG